MNIQKDNLIEFMKEDFAERILNEKEIINSYKHSVQICKKEIIHFTELMNRKPKDESSEFIREMLDNKMATMKTQTAGLKNRKKYLAELQAAFERFNIKINIGLRVIQGGLA